MHAALEKNSARFAAPLSGLASRTLPLADEYFDQTMLNRQRLLWAVATRRQLERWEPLVAGAVVC